MQEQYPLSSADCVLLASPYVFDASVSEMFWPLTNGASVAAMASEQRNDPMQVGHLLSALSITVLTGVPLFLAALADARAAGQIPAPQHLKLTITGGAAISREVRSKYMRTFPGRLMNHYGPTEVTVDASVFDCSHDFKGATVPIGRPINNTRMFILDRRQRPVPIGVAGEIYLASPGLARGYLGDPERTSRAFAYRSLDGGQPIRLYRTGDLGKYDADGTIYYLGRTDKQVKIRGNRVELEEIESWLSAHPNITNCAVRAVDRDSNRERLVAYLELNTAYNGFSAEGQTYQLFTLAQRPELLRRIEAVHLESWPDFFAGEPILKELWPRIWTEYSGYQFALVNHADEVVAAGNALPFSWDGEVASLPPGWDAALTQGLSDSGSPSNTLLILAGVILPAYQGQGLSRCLLQAFKALAHGIGHTRMVVPVRPTGKADHPEMSFAAWCESRRADGLPMDPWLRIHERVGGRPLRIEHRSQRVVGSLSQWQTWTGSTFTESGEYHVPGGLHPVHIDIEHDLGEYYEPSIWYQHFPESYQGPAWAPCGKREIRDYLADTLPEYMIPEQMSFIVELPRTPSGKLDEQRLPEARWEGGQTLQPNNPLQSTLARIFCKVLNLESPGIADDFFHLGGQSLTAIQLLNLIAEELDIRLALKAFYRDPTILGLERLIRSAKETPA
jgi:acyl-CoA synthetase (AMP-forming)/AMP-acid ligase II